MDYSRLTDAQLFRLKEVNNDFSKLSDDELMGMKQQLSASPLATPKPKEEPPTLIGAGIQDIYASGKTALARGLMATGMPQWGKAVEESAEANRARAAQRPVTDIDVDPITGIYEGVVRSLPSMAPAVGGAMAGAKFGAPFGPWGAGLGALVGGAAASYPMLLGSNLERQTEEQKIPLAQTDLGTAAGAAGVQSLLEGLIGPVLFGKIGLIPARAAASTLKRVATKAIESGATEGLTEASQQWIEVLQANPEKAINMPPEVVKEIRDSGLIGMFLGGTVGGVTGIPKPKSSSPTAEEPPAVPPAPPGTLPTEDSWASHLNTLRNIPDSFPGLEDTDIAPGLYGHQIANDWQQVPDFFTGFGQESDLATNGNPLGAWNFGEAPVAPQSATQPAQMSIPRGIGFGLPGSEQPFTPDGSVMGLPPANTGIRVFDEVKAAGIAQGLNPIQAASVAAAWRARYETLGKQIGTDAYTAFKNSNISFETPGRNKVAPPGGTTLNQDELPRLAMFYSQLQNTLKNPSMKTGTGQQWINYLQRNQVKPEELKWTGLGDFLTENKNRNLTAQDLMRNNRFQPFDLAVYEADPHAQNKTNHYGEWTLDGYGENPDSGYKEIVFAAESLPKGAYQSSHWPKVNNPVAHARKTDRQTTDGKPVYFLEEVQSDWHEDGRKRGYRGTEEDLIRARMELDKALDLRDEFDGDPQRFSAQERENIFNRVEVAWKKMDGLQRGLPDAPYKETWPNLVLRQALMDAINNGQEYLAWPTAEQMMKIQGHGGEKKANAHREFYDKRLVNAAEKLVKGYGGKVEKVELGAGRHLSTLHQTRLNSWQNQLEQLENDPEISYDPELQTLRSDLLDKINSLKQSGAHTVHAVRITPAMRELISAGGLPLFQRTVGQKTPTPKGNINILPDRMIIRLFANADVTTLMHEGAHAFVTEMVRYAPTNRQIARDLATLRKWVGNNGEPFTADQHEQIARGFEHYLREGNAPTTGLKKIFEDFKKWFTAIYNQAKLMKLDMTPEVRQVFDNWFNQTDQALKAPKGSVIGSIKTEPLRGTVENARVEGEPGEQQPGLYTQSLNQDELPEQVSRWRRTKDATKAFFDPFSNIPNEGQYRDIRNLTRGGVWAAQKAADDARALFAGLNQQEKNRANEYFETRAADPAMLPPSIRDKAVELKRFINGPLKQQLQDKGLLPREGMERYDDSYLPRLYLKHLVESLGYRGGFRENKMYARKRKDKSGEMLIEMGEVKDPGVRTYFALFRTMRDIAIRDFLTQIAQNPEWTLPKSLVDWEGQKVTPFWLKNEAAHILERRIPAEPNPERKKAMRERAALMEDAATEGIIAMGNEDYDAKEYKKLPDSHDYGPLRGAIVRKQIAEDIQGTNDFVNPDNFIDRWFGDRNSMLTRATSFWKVLKVPLNPPSVVRNIVSNMVLLNLSGIPIQKVVPRLIQAANDMRHNGRFTQIAQKWGVSGSTFSEQELYAISDELNRLDLSNDSGFAGWRKASRVILKTVGKATDFYGKLEEWGKIAKIIDEIEGNDTPENIAVQRANKALFDYSEAHPSIKRLRQMPLGMPFATFSYKVIPLMAEIVRNRPTILLPYIAMSAVIPALVAASNDIGPDDEEKLRQALSKALRRKNSMYLLPWKDAEGRWQFIDIGYFLPWQMPYEIIKEAIEAGENVATGKGQDALKNLGQMLQTSTLLSNPVLNISAALTTGVDPFTGRPIADKRDPPQKQVMDVVSYAWSLAAPSLLASYGAAGQLVSKESGTGMNRFGEPSTTYGQIAARALGMNVYPIIPEAQRARNIQQMQYEIQNVKSRMTSTLKDRSLTPEQRRNVIEDFRDEIMYRTGELQKYIKKSAPSERLQRASSS